MPTCRNVGWCIYVIISKFAGAKFQKYLLQKPLANLRRCDQDSANIAIAAIGPRMANPHSFLFKSDK